MSVLGNFVDTAATQRIPFKHGSCFVLSPSGLTTNAFFKFHTNFLSSSDQGGRKQTNIRGATRKARNT